jgi:hypothetical protein
MKRLIFLTVLLLALGAGTPAMANALAGPQLADAKAWGLRFAEAMASGEPARAAQMLRTVYTGSTAFRTDQFMEQITRFMRAGGKKEHVDLVEDLLRGTSVYVSTHFISMEGEEMFVRVRFHRWARGWYVGDIEFTTDYDKIPWGK